MIEEEERIIIVKGSRILTPSVANKIREQLNPEYKMIYDVQLNTGLRQVEFWWLMRNPQCYRSNRRIIDLPKEGACKKPNCKTDSRTIRLTVAGARAMDNIIQNRVGADKPKAERCFGGALTRAAIRAGVNPKGINPKCLRKSMESWLVETRMELGIDFLEIVANQGHTESVSLKNYLGFAWSPQEHRDMLEFFKGWKQ
jgi:integrase